ncbi:MAG: hypothetical protein AAGA48_40830 [Myxococcota bacterium]
MLRLYNGEPANVAAFLIGDQEADRLLGPSSACHAIGSLRRYVEKIYGPWRAKDRPRTWVTEERAWHAILLVSGDVQPGNVDEFLVANYLDEIVVRSGPRQGQPASGNTMRIRRAAIQALLNRAYRLQHIDRLPKLSTFRLRDSTRRVRRKPDPLTPSMPKHGFEKFPFEGV